MTKNTKNESNIHKCIYASNGRRTKNEEKVKEAKTVKEAKKETKKQGGNFFKKMEYQRVYQR